MKEYFLHQPATHHQTEPQKPSDAGSRDSATGMDGSAPLSWGERVYLEIVQNESGREISEEAFANKQAERAKLRAQSLHIAALLESEGEKAYGESKLTMVGLLTGIEEPMIDFRNIVFIPEVAKRKRNKMLGDLEYFLDQHPFARMWVFTSGERCPIADVESRIKDVHRRISKLNAVPFMKAAGITIVFRSSELGSLKRVAGKPTFHIHCHTIIDLARKLRPADWSRVLGQVRAWWKFHFSDAKRVEMVREACKYVVKPNDLLELSGPELKALHHQLFKLHLVQTLGPLRSQRKDREDANQCFHRFGGPQGSKLKKIPKWNTRPKLPPASGGKPRPDTVLATLVPGPYFSRVVEPAAVVMNRSKETIVERNARLYSVWLAATNSPGQQKEKPIPEFYPEV